MGEQVGRFMDTVGSIFRGSDTLPWCDRDLIAGFESEVAEAATEAQKNDSLMRLSWALVHSRQPEDVNRGIGMLQGNIHSAVRILFQRNDLRASLDKTSSPLEIREKLYLLAVGHYRTGDYTRSRQLLERCLEIQPDWRQALTLQQIVEDKTRRGLVVVNTDGMIGMAIITGAFGVVGLVAGGIIAAASSSSSRKK
ncbi:hypothetical protein PR202_gb19910 [Eleusine coracana subsp. coracana]|uniref:Mitochondrial fission 1 protein n=1 Tax=Eleusine coracana subsp. coracana TaxID=191504 RepID=A0AAV5F8V9_ELECO|nr:hypothetical protein PR202_gb19910 [Eleusine coracana subsp. coracana]